MKKLIAIILLATASAAIADGSTSTVVVGDKLLICRTVCDDKGQNCRVICL